MAIASALTTQDIIDDDLRISNALVSDLQFYDRAAYSRIGQLTKGDQDSIIETVLLPKASIELLLALEMGWWPGFAESHMIQPNKQVNNRTVTNFDPTLLIKQGQTLIELEVFKAIQLFYSTVVTDSANVNDKDQANYSFAEKRFNDAWSKAVRESAFYDLNSDNAIDGEEDNAGEVDSAIYDGDRRYF